MSRIGRLTNAVTSHSRIVITVMLVLTLLVGSGAGMVEENTSIDQYVGDSEASQAFDYVNRNFSTGAENATYAQVVVRGANVLSRDALLETLRLQQAFRENRTVGPTLAGGNDATGEQATIGVANVVATRAVLQTRPPDADPSPPTLQEQIDRLESMNATEVDRTVRTVFDPETPGSEEVLAFMPGSYEPGSTTANATMVVIVQQSDQGVILDADRAPREIVDSQLAMREIANRQAERGDVDFLVYGIGLMGEEINWSMADSMAVVGPLALLFVLVALIVAYRDTVDVLLGLVGIGAVLAWTFGIMGWIGIEFNQVMIAVPVLLIGLSIDYALHIVMRYRERRAAEGASGESVRESMGSSLAHVGVALGMVTVTTAIGFLANLASRVGQIQAFGIASAIGIASTLLVFGLLTPALKVEIDAFLERRGVDRTRPAFGTGGTRLSRALSVGAIAARKAPLLVVLLAVLVSGAGAYGATQVETSFNTADFLAEDPPDWMDEAPEPFAPSDYTVKRNLAYLNEHFPRQDLQVHVLVRGDLTDPATLDRLDRAEHRAARSEITQTLPNGEPRIQSPLAVMRQVAARNETFGATFAAADADADGVPDRNLARVYDALFAVAPDQAAEVVHRTDDGEVRALRTTIMTHGAVPDGKVTDETRAVAASIDGDGVTATATGRPVLYEIISERLLETVETTLLVTLVAVFAFLAIAYRLTSGSATLGVLTLVPVLLNVTWILGTMHLLGYDFNGLTGMITSLTVGLGIDYSIHVSERYTLELERTGEVGAALQAAVTGTGGALLGSAATTASGFGVLGFALLPGLQQFGVITALTIVYAFLASVLVLPSFLVVWTKYFGPQVDTATSTTSGRTSTTAPSDEMT